MRKIGAESTYEECSPSPYELFVKTGDVSLFEPYCVHIPRLLLATGCEDPSAQTCSTGQFEAQGLDMGKC